jgi:hypothetical protein
MLTLSFQRLAAARLRLDRISNSRGRVGLLPRARLWPRGRLTCEAAIRARIFGGSRPVDCLELSVALDRFIYACGLRRKRLRSSCRCALRQKAVRRAHSRCGCRTNGPISHTQTVTSGNHRQIARHHAPVTQVRGTHPSGQGCAATKARCRHARDTCSYPIVNEHVVKIGKLIAAMQRRDSIPEAADSIKSYNSEAVAITAPPGMEEVARSYRKPAN